MNNFIKLSKTIVNLEEIDAIYYESSSYKYKILFKNKEIITITENDYNKFKEYLEKEVE